MLLSLLHGKRATHVLKWVAHPLIRFLGESLAQEPDCPSRPGIKDDIG
jgi:hypothetical protein